MDNGKTEDGFVRYSQLSQPQRGAALRFSTHDEDPNWYLYRVDDNGKVAEAKPGGYEAERAAREAESHG